MTRPLTRHTIAELEKLFASSKDNDKLLENLAHELQFRQTPRAIELLREVQAALSETEPSAGNPWFDITGPVQHRLDMGEAALSETPATPVVKPIASGGTSDSLTLPVAPATHPNRPALTMSVEDAYKILGVTQTATWESIEQIRRQLVQRAHPEHLATMSKEKRAQAQIEAKQVNAAYSVLIQHRTRHS